ncbi:hypothetical protein GOV12_08090 [Candidatus Pacearchaeota archaeon]|nr:hypothetical protein [Candidatus Pacearchaeota archaeon]
MDERERAYEAKMRRMEAEVSGHIPDPEETKASVEETPEHKVLEDIRSDPIDKPDDYDVRIHSHETQYVKPKSVKSGPSILEKAAMSVSGFFGALASLPYKFVLPVVLGAGIGITAASISYNHEVAKERSIPLGFSEITQIEDDY